MYNFSFCLNQIKAKLKAIQPEEIHLELVFKLKSCKLNNQMYKTLQKTYKIIFASNQVVIIDVVH